MKEVAPILDGKYLRSDTRKNPPAELAAAMGLPVLDTAQNVKQEA
jgi:NAD(P)H-quinone oxidoreductase subunit K